MYMLVSYYEKHKIIVRVGTFPCVSPPFPTIHIWVMCAPVALGTFSGNIV